MLITKLNKPNSTNKLIFRKELIDKLESGKEKKLTLVSAPAGYGKSTLISQWIDQCEISCMWYSLDKSDNDIVIFLQYIIAGILSKYKNLEFKTEKLLESNSNPSYETLATFLINDLLEIKENFYIILDDYHLIENKEINNFTYYLLSNLPDNIHLVLITRSDPSIPLARLRSQQLVTDIRLSDLSFNAKNIYDFFKKSLNINLSIDDARNLESKTEGWIAGLQLAGLSLQGRDDVSDLVKKLKGDNRYIMDYLIEEVLRNQPDELQVFLLKTSVLEQISAPICNAILERNDSQLILEQLERENMFVIPLDNERRWFRYHHLFADLLKQRLMVEDGSMIKSLHKDASRWFEENDMCNLAIEHALVAKDYERSIQVINKTVEAMWLHGKHTAILDYGEKLPDELIKEYPEFCLYYSWILIGIGEIKKAYSFLDSAEKKLSGLIQADNLKNEIVNYYYKELLGKVYVAFALLSSKTEPIQETTHYCKTAIKYLSHKDKLWLGWTWYFIGNKEMAKGNWFEGNKALNTALDYGKKTDNFHLMSVITITLANHKMAMGQYKSAYKDCSELLTFINKTKYAEITKAEWVFSGLYTTMSVMQCIWTDFDDALENVKIGYSLCKEEKYITQKIMALLAYTYVLYAQGDKEGSWEKLLEFEAVMKQNILSPFLITNYVGWKIFLLAESDQLDLANQFAIENGLGIKNKISYENCHSNLQYARLLIIQHNYNEAENILSEIHALANAFNHIEMLVQYKTVYALMYKIMGNHEAAVQNLLEAMELASDENLLNYFLYDLAYTNDLIKEIFKIAATRKTRISKTFINKLKLAIETKEDRKEKQVESELSTRELETLVLIAEGLSNQEIAEKLFLSIHTIKSHVKSILFKLDVDKRSKAVVKAKELKII